MNQLRFTFAICLAVILNSYVNAQNFDWATSFMPVSGHNSRFIEDICIDPAANSYTLGTFNASIVIDGDTIVPYKAPAYSCYIVKKDIDGNTLWVKTFGTNTYNFAEQILYAKGHLYVSAYLPGDSVYHSNGAFAVDPLYRAMLLKFDTDGNYISHVGHDRSFRYTVMAATDSVIYAAKYGQIDKYNFDLHRTGNFALKGRFSITTTDIAAVNDTSILITGQFGGYVTYRGDTIHDTFSGSGYPAFLASINANDELHWMYAYGKAYLEPKLFYYPHDQYFYLAGNYNDNFEIDGHEFALSQFNGAHGFLVRCNMQGEVIEKGVLNPTHNGDQQLIDIVATDRHVYAAGRVLGGGVNYNMGDTLYRWPNYFGYVYKFDRALNEIYSEGMHTINRQVGGSVTIKAIAQSRDQFGRENLIIGGTSTIDLILGCDTYPARGSVMFNLVDAVPDDLPQASFYYADRGEGNIRFFTSMQNKDYHYWDFGDDSPFDSVKINPYHQYDRKGEILVKLHAGNKCGEKVYEKTVKIKGLGEMNPAETHNNNLYIGQIKGVGFRDDATFTLRDKNGAEKAIRDYQYVDSTTYNILIEFDHQPTTSYDLYMQNGGDNDTLVNALEVIDGTKHDIQIEFSGPPEVLGKRRYTYTANIENKGDETAYGVPVSICVPINSEPMLNTRILASDEHRDWINKMKGPFRPMSNQGFGDFEVATFFFPVLPGKASYKINFSIITGSSEDSRVGAVFDRPLYSGTSFFIDPETTAAVLGDSIVCPDNRAVDFMLDLFNLDALEPGINIPNLGCVLYSFLIEQIGGSTLGGGSGSGGSTGFNGTPWGGGFNTSNFTGNLPLPQPANQPWYFAPIIIESIKRANPDMPDENAIATYENYIETFPNSTNDSGSVPDVQGEPESIEYPTDILCVSDCELSIYLYHELPDCSKDPEACHLPLEPIPTMKKEDLVNDETIEDKARQLDLIIEEDSFWKQVWEVWYEYSVQNSKDPNEKYAVSGFGEESFTLNNTNLTYHITFENADTATAPASEVFVYDTLDLSVLDTTYFEWKSFGWADYFIPLNEQGTSVNKLFDTRPYGDNFILEFDGKIDENGILSAVFTSLDTATLALTNNLHDGFLKPNINKPEGEGYFTFTIAQQPNLEHGTSIANQAVIVFDRNEPIYTGVAINTIDIEPPHSTIIPFENELQQDSIIHVQIEGSDSGSGIKGYNVYIKKNDSPYSLMLRDYTRNDFYIAANYGDTYSFIAAAKDNVNNVEYQELIAEATVKVENKATSVFTPELSEHVLIYPNPVIDDATVTVSYGIELEKYIIHDITGQKVMERDFEAIQPAPIKTAKLSAGIYIVDIYTSKGIARHKIYKR